MDAWIVVRDLVILLTAALAFGMAFERLGTSAMLGYLVAGMMVGPSLLGFVGNEALEVASETGVAMLLFTIGLETSWSRFRAMGGLAAGGGTVQIIATTAVTMGAAMLFGLEWKTAMILGFCVSLSSTATVLQSLQHRGEQDSLHGRAAFGVLLLQDGAVVPLVLITNLIARGGSLGSVAESFSLAALRAMLLVFVVIFIGGRVMPRLFDAASLARARELPVLLALISCLAAVIAAHAADLSPALGAFVAGMVLADSKMATQIRADVAPIRAVLVTLFFASVGMQADIGWLFTGVNLLIVLGVACAVIVAKAIIAGFSLRLFGAAPLTAAAAGVCIAQIGEFSFVLASEARRVGLFGADAFQTIAGATLVTLLLSPLLVSSSRRLARMVVRSGSTSTPEPRHEGGPHILLIGFGPAGHEAVEQLRDSEIPITVLETNPRSVGQALAAGLQAFVGDATRPEVLEHAGLDSALAVVITIPDHVAASQVIAELRAHRPNMPIVARARHHRYAQRLRISPEDVVVDEEEAVGRLLGFEAYLAARAELDRRARNDAEDADAVPGTKAIAASDASVGRVDDTDDAGRGTA